MRSKTLVFKFSSFIGMIEEPFVSSDHCVVKFDITCNISRKDWKLFYYDYRRGNY